MKVSKPVNLDILLETPEFCYFLGLLFADGYIGKSTEKKKGNYIVAITTTEVDIEYFEKIFKKFYDFKVYTRQRENWKSEYTFTFSNKHLHKFLIDIGFDNKPQNASKIISNIKDHKCRQLFFTGLFDGDGCVYYNQKNFSRQASISGCLEQNWDFLVEICLMLGIENYKITETIKPNGHTSSNFRICNKKEFDIFLSYIYETPEFGFKRKIDKWKLAMSTTKTGPRFNPKLRSVKRFCKSN